MAVACPADKSTLRGSAQPVQGPTLPETLRKTLAILTPHERHRGLLLGTVMVMTTFEVVGVASFLAVLGNPSVVQNNTALATAHECLGM